MQGCYNLSVFQLWLFDCAKPAVTGVCIVLLLGRAIESNQSGIRMGLCHINAKGVTSPERTEHPNEWKVPFVFRKVTSGCILSHLNAFRWFRRKSKCAIIQRAFLTTQPHIFVSGHSGISCAQSIPGINHHTIINNHWHLVFKSATLCRYQLIDLAILCYTNGMRIFTDELNQILPNMITDFNNSFLTSWPRFNSCIMFCVWEIKRS